MTPTRFVNAFVIVGRYVGCRFVLFLQRAFCCHSRSVWHWRKCLDQTRVSKMQINTPENRNERIVRPRNVDYSASALQEWFRKIQKIKPTKNQKKIKIV